MSLRSLGERELYGNDVPCLGTGQPNPAVHVMALKGGRVTAKGHGSEPNGAGPSPPTLAGRVTPIRRAACQEVGRDPGHVPDA